MENASDPDPNNKHGEALPEWHVRIEGEDAARNATHAQRGLALWTRMAALELWKTKLAGPWGSMDVRQEAQRRRPRAETGMQNS